MLFLASFSHSILLLRSAAAQQVFTLAAYLPGSPLDGLAVNAGGQSFYLGGSPSYYCPSFIGKYCPNTTTTVFTPGLGALDVSLSSTPTIKDDADCVVQVEVPGGQIVYTAQNGLLGFTQAHSAYVPAGAYYGGFQNMTIVSDCSAPVVVLNWASAASGKHFYEAREFADTNVIVEGLLACPYMISGQPSTTVQQIYIDTPEFNKTGCTKLHGLLPTYLPNGSPPGAWQYI